MREGAKSGRNRATGTPYSLLSRFDRKMGTCRSKVRIFKIISAMQYLVCSLTNNFCFEN